MTNFIIPAFLLLVLVLLLLLRPFIFPGKTHSTSRRQMNVSIYREELDKLEAERQSGLMDEQSYALAHAELRQRLFQDTNEEDDKSFSKSPKITILGILIFVLILSSGLYFVLGDATRVAQKNAEKPVTQEAVERMVTEFAQKMEKDPQNLKGWVMLARSYRILGRNQEAEKAYARAGDFVNSDPQLLADYADVIATNTNGDFSGKPMQLINQALKLDPNNLLALWLSGSASFSTQNYKVAVQTWEKLNSLLPAQSDESRAIQASIAEAREKGHLPASAPLVMSDKAVSGIVEVAADLQSKIKPGDILMVIARKPGERMPVAVLKTDVTKFPMSFALNDALAMNPQMPISQLPEVSVEVRISKTGMAKAETGDLISKPKIVTVGTSKVRLLIDQAIQ